MVLNIGERITGFLFTPSETFDNSRDDTLGDAVKYFVSILAIYAVLNSTMFILSVSSMMPQVLTIIGGPYIGTIITFIFMLVYGIFGIFLMGLWTHIWLYFIGGKKGVTQTLKALLYGATPYCLLGWISSIYLVTSTYGGNTSGILNLFSDGIRFAGIPIAIWAFIIAIIGIRQLHELSTGKATLAVIIAIMIPAIILHCLHKNPQIFEQIPSPLCEEII
jgi:hypothetical protein